MEFDAHEYRNNEEIRHDEKGGRKRERERKIWQELYAISLMKRIYILYQENAN